MSKFCSECFGELTNGVCSECQIVKPSKKLSFDPTKLDFEGAPTPRGFEWYGPKPGEKVEWEKVSSPYKSYKE